MSMDDTDKATYFLPGVPNQVITCDPGPIL